MAQIADYNQKYMPLPIGIKRGNPNPVDTTSVWGDETLLEQYRKDLSGTSYVGQILTLVGTDVVSAFVIKNTAGDLTRLAGIGEVETASGNVLAAVSSLSSNASDTDVLLGNRITALSGAITGSSGGVGNLSAYAKNRDDALEGMITSLSSNASSKDGEISTSISTLSSNASSTDFALSSSISELSGIISGIGAITGVVTLGTAQDIGGDKYFSGALTKVTTSNDGVQGWGDIYFMTKDRALVGNVVAGCSNATQHDIHVRAYKGNNYSGIACLYDNNGAIQALEFEPTADETSTTSTQIASRGWVNSHFARGAMHEAVTVQTQSSPQQVITLDTLVAWLLNNTICRELWNGATHASLTTSWSYAGNDILWVEEDGVARRETLAGCQITMSGYFRSWDDCCFTLEIQFCPQGISTGNDLDNCTLVYRNNGTAYSRTVKIYANRSSVDALSANALARDKAITGSITRLRGGYTGDIQSIDNRVTELSGAISGSVSNHEEVTIKTTTASMPAAIQMDVLVQWLLDYTICGRLHGNSFGHVYLTTNTSVKGNDILLIPNSDTAYTKYQTLAGCQIRMSGYAYRNDNHCFTIEIQFSSQGECRVSTGGSLTLIGNRLAGRTLIYTSPSNGTDLSKGTVYVHEYDLDYLNGWFTVN